jgi:hypothetical protein
LGYNVETDRIRRRKRNTMESKIRIGSTIPDFSLPDLEGRIVNSRDFLGKRVALFVWASW